MSHQADQFVTVRMANPHPEPSKFGSFLDSMRRMFSSEAPPFTSRPIFLFGKVYHVDPEQSVCWRFLFKFMKDLNRFTNFSKTGYSLHHYPVEILR